MNGKEASQNILAPGVADHHGHWLSCKLDINNCSSNQLDPMQDNDLSIIHLKGMKFIDVVSCVWCNLPKYLENNNVACISYC
ncbi:unnamed protein product [Trifolium pratense]|uniref:Uncharacterized protein n=1 Tax=Trifolium pratense TaxID=57577 RepID=A0ACB0JFR9_TRIPR|nr:unnamed protein product [Trifolium pratense]